MSRSSVLVALSFLCALATTESTTAADVHSLLVKADTYRLTAGAARVLTSVELYRNDTLDKERQYLVYLRPERRSLVLSQSPVEKGQKILMLGDDFWIVLPSSQRPIRITPAQKLLGDAAAGDVATMTWAEDYDGTITGETEVNGIACVHLDLVATRRGVTYHRIDLYLSKANSQPVQADLYVASEKLAKRANFTMSVVDGQAQVSAMTLIDNIQTGRKTVIRYLARSARTIADEYYNPMFLTHHDPE